jgi:membrane-associated phospholipid phosphatase
MPAGTGIAQPSHYFAQLVLLVRLSLAQLVGAPTHSRRAEAARRLTRQILLLTGTGAVVIVALMVVLDVKEIALMPPRGTAGLWPVRILTDFGRSADVLWLLAAMLFFVTLILPGLRGTSRVMLVSVGTRIEFLLFAVLVPVLAGEAIKYAVGRGRPFVGGAANAFNFAPFAGTEAYASFPSGHAITCAALAFAVSVLWPRLRGVMIVYAALIVASRLVLLAHHPSVVVAGALLGLIGAMTVRYWFAARHLAFTIRPDGSIAELTGPSAGHLKRVARGALAP